MAGSTWLRTRLRTAAPGQAMPACAPDGGWRRLARPRRPACPGGGRRRLANHGGLRARAEGGGAWPATAACALGGGRRRLASHGGLRAGRLAGPPPGVPAPGLEGRDGRQEA